MRITFVLPTVDFSGGVRVVAEIAQRLIDRGHLVNAVCPGRPDRSLKGKAYHLLQNGTWPKRNASPLRSHFDAVRVPLKVLDTYRPVTAEDVPDADVIVSTWWETAHWVAAMPASKGAKASFFQQYETAFGAPRGGVESAWRLSAHKIVCASWLACKAKADFDDDDVDIVNNGVDSHFFNASPRAKQSTFTVGLLYDPRPVKGLRTALAALALFRTHRPLRVVTIGTFQPEPRLPLPPNTLFAREPEQALLPELYARCDAWLCTSTSEGFHLPPHEAMACRTPVVSTRVGGPTDLIQEGVNGFLADVGDGQRLSEHLETIAAMSDDAWRAMSAAARETAVRYSWPLAAEQMERALHHAIERSRA